jgi:hypothetical protein
MGWEVEMKKKKFYNVKQPSFEQREKERNRISEIFVREYGEPVLAHAVDRKESFVKILKQGELKIPKDHNSPKKFLYMERLLGIENSIFLSLGFVYFIDYQLKYNLIFNLDLLKNSDFYKRPLPFKCYRKIIDDWYKKDRKYLNRIMKSSKKMREIIGSYIKLVESNTKVRPLRYWEYEKGFYEAIMKYPKKNKLIRKAKRMQKELLVGWPYSKRSSKKRYLKNDSPEILYHKSIGLLEHPSFMGFFIAGKISKDVQAILKKKYKGKILFDGKKIEVIE